VPRKAVPISDRYRVADTGCYEWTGPVDAKGYGVITRRGIKQSSSKAHRVAWIEAHGPIADGLWVLHRCDNRRCVRLEHLYLGTPLDNMRDVLARGRHNISRLSLADVIRFRERADAGEPVRVLAAEFGIAENTGHRIKSRRSWRQSIGLLSEPLGQQADRQGLRSTRALTGAGSTR
jgi:hypothetical protein